MYLCMSMTILRTLLHLYTFVPCVYPLCIYQVYDNFKARTLLHLYTFVPVYLQYLYMPDKSGENKKSGKGLLLNSIKCPAMRLKCPAKLKNFVYTASYLYYRLYYNCSFSNQDGNLRGRFHYKLHSDLFLTLKSFGVLFWLFSVADLGAGTRGPWPPPLLDNAPFASLCNNL